MISEILHIFLIYCIPSVNAWNLPPSKFLQDFAREHDRKNVILHLPENSQNKWIQWSKDFQKETKLTTIPWSKNNITIGSKDLHVFVPDDSPNMFDTISRLKDVFCPRSSINSEYWLFDESIWALPFEIDELPLRLDDNFYIFKGNENSITIWEYYEIHTTVPRKFQFYGTWSLVEGLSITKIDKWTRRQNLQGAKFSIQTMRDLHMPFFFQIFFGLRNALNFTYSVSRPTDNVLGDLLPDGTWTGIIGSLRRKEVDVGVGAFKMTPERFQVISFSKPIILLYHEFFIERPTASHKLDYLKPMTLLTWISVLAFCLVSPIILCLTARVESKDSDWKNFRYVQSLRFLLGCLTIRPFVVTPTKISTRISFLIILLSSPFIYLLWWSKLFLYLSKNQPQLPFNDLESLMNNYDYQISVIPGNDLEDDFQNSKDPLWQKAWLERLKPNLQNLQTFYKSPFPTKALLEFPKTSIYGLHNIVSKSPEFEDCRIVALPKKYNFESYSFALQKNSPYLVLFNRHLQKIIENGVLNQILKKHQGKTQHCEDKESDRAINLETILIPLTILIFGTLYSIIIFGIEIFATHFGWDLPFCFHNEAENVDNELPIPTPFKYLLDEKDLMINELNYEIYELKRTTDTKKDQMIENLKSENEFLKEHYESIIAQLELEIEFQKPRMDLI